MTDQEEPLVGERWAYRVGAENLAEQVEVVTIPDNKCGLEVEFIDRGNKRKWVSREHLETLWDDMPDQDRAVAVETWQSKAHRETAGELLEMALALLADAGKPSEAWILYKRWHPSASARQWRVISALAIGNARYRVSLWQRKQQEEEE